MALTLGDNFSYQGAKPLDARLKYATLAEMKAVADATMYDGCMAYCVATDKTYQWKSTNSVDETLGRWREFSSGGGGGGTTDYADLDNKPQINENTLSGNKTSSELGLASKEDMDKAYKSDDTAFTDIADGDYIPVYDTSATAKKKSLWSNIKSVLKTYFDTLYSTVKESKAQASGGTALSLVTTGEKYDLNTGSSWYGTCSTSASTTAKAVTLSRGTFNLVAGARIAVKFTYTNTASSPTLKIGTNTAKNIKYIDESGTVTTPSVWWNANEVVDFVYDGTQFIMMPTYTMALTPKGNKIQPSSIYSTSETMIGKWTDGRPIYQKIITGSMPTVSKDGTAVTSTFNIGATVKEIIFGVVRVNNSGNNYILNDAMPSSSVTSMYARATFRNNSHSSPNTLSITNTMVAWSGLPFTAIVQYTKTTDSTSSYNLANPTDYSTSEKVIGTWIDGKTLYQKTFSATMPTYSSGYAVTKDVTYSTVGINNVDKVIDVEGYIYNDTSNIFRPLSCTTEDINGQYFTCVLPWQTMLRLVNKVAGLSDKTAYITLRYTKTT